MMRNRISVPSVGAAPQSRELTVKRKIHSRKNRLRPKVEASHVFFKSYDGYSTNNPLAVCLDDDVLIAHSWNGKPLSTEHGGPARVIIPKRYAWKGAKFIREIEFLDSDQLGFWEVRGYSNTADPWSEDRFARRGEPPPGFP